MALGGWQHGYFPPAVHASRLRSRKGASRITQVRGVGGGWGKQGCPVLGSNLTSEECGEALSALPALASA